MHQLLHDQRSSHLISCTAHHTCSYPTSRPFPCVLPELAGTHDLAAHRSWKIPSFPLFSLLNCFCQRLTTPKLPLSCTIDITSCFDSALHTDVILYSQSLCNLYLFAIWLCAQSSDHLGGKLSSNLLSPKLCATPTLVHRHSIA
jgi:hypothetical protein